MPAQETPGPRLVVTAPVSMSGEVHPLDAEHLVIGRSERSRVRLDDEYVSREHAQLELTSGGYVLTDLRSTGGTTVNGVLVQTPRRLADGDVVRFGPLVEARFEDPWARGETPTLIYPAEHTQFAPPAPGLAGPPPQPGRSGTAHGSSATQGSAGGPSAQAYPGGTEPFVPVWPAPPAPPRPHFPGSAEPRSVRNDSAPADVPPGSFFAAQQNADQLNNVARDQYIQHVIAERESFLRAVAASRTRARWLIAAGFVLFVAGAGVYLWTLIRFAGRIQNAAGTSDGTDFKLFGDEIAGVPIGLIGFVAAAVGSVFMGVGIVLHIVASARRRRVEATPLSGQRTGQLADASMDKAPPYTYSGAALQPGASTSHPGPSPPGADWSAGASPRRR